MVSGSTTTFGAGEITMIYPLFDTISAIHAYISTGDPYTITAGIDVTNDTDTPKLVIYNRGENSLTHKLALSEVFTFEGGDRITAIWLQISDIVNIVSNGSPYTFTANTTLHNNLPNSVTLNDTTISLPSYYTRIFVKDDIISNLVINYDSLEINSAAMFTSYDFNTYTELTNNTTYLIYVTGSVAAFVVIGGKQRYSPGDTITSISPIFNSIYDIDQYIQQYGYFTVPATSMVYNNYSYTVSINGDTTLASGASQSFDIGFTFNTISQVTIINVGDIQSPLTVSTPTQVNNNTSLNYTYRYFEGGANTFGTIASGANMTFNGGAGSTISISPVYTNINDIQQYLNTNSSYNFFDNVTVSNSNNYSMYIESNMGTVTLAANTSYRFVTTTNISKVYINKPISSIQQYLISGGSGTRFNEPTRVFNDTLSSVPLTIGTQNGIEEILLGISTVLVFGVNDSIIPRRPERAIFNITEIDTYIDNSVYRSYVLPQQMAIFNDTFNPVSVTTSSALIRIESRATADILPQGTEIILVSYLGS
jgi:hypothetical protein